MGSVKRRIEDNERGIGKYGHKKFVTDYPEEKLISMFKSEKPVMKIVVVGGGSGAPGKTALLLRYVNNIYNRYSLKTTMGCGFFIKEIDVIKDVGMKIQFWDINQAGHSEGMSKNYYMGLSSAIIVCDLDDFNISFDQAKKWYEDITKNAQPVNNFIFIIGTKCDLLSKDELEKQKICLQEFAEEIGAIKYFITSAKEDIGVQEAFTAIAEINNNVLLFKCCCSFDGWREI